MKYLVLLFCLLLSFNASGQEREVTVDQLFSEAMRFHKSGQYSKAIKNYTLIIENVDDKEIRRQMFIKRGLAKNSIKNYKSAINDFTEAIKLDSTDMASFVDRGLSLYYDRQLEMSEKDFLFVKKENANKRMVENSTYWLIKIEQKRFNHKQANEYCDELIAVNSNDAEFYFLRAFSYGRLMNHKKEIKDYSKALKLNPNYVQAITNRGVAKINLLTTKGILKPSKKETKSACKDLKKAFKLGDKLNTEDLIFVYCNDN